MTTKVSSAMQDTMVVADLPAGSVVQVVNVQDGETATGSTNFPFDDTIPQITEGVEYMTLAITPTSATNKLFIQVIILQTAVAAGAWETSALFQDSTADALASMINNTSGVSATGILTYSHYMTAGTTSSTTFRVRSGGSTGATMRFNGDTQRRMGGTLSSSITITEIAV